MENKELVRLPFVIPNAGGKHEILLAQALPESELFRICSIPAFVYGVGLDDEVRLLEDETFDLVRRGGNVTVRLYIRGSLERPDIKELLDDIVALDGAYEVGRQAGEASATSLLLCSLPLSAGFSRIESLFKPFETGDDQWEYGNVYDAAGNPLNWW